MNDPNNTNKDLYPNLTKIILNTSNLEGFSDDEISYIQDFYFNLII